MAAPSKPSLTQATQTSGALPDFPNFAPSLIQTPGAQETNAKFQTWWTSLKYRLLTTENGNQQALFKITAEFNGTSTGLQAQITEERTVRANADTALAQDITSVSASMTTGFDTLTASVTAVSTALATSNGYLQGKYTLTVTAGNVVTGMNITSASGPGTNISSVIFQASEFKIYNGTTGIPAFSLVGSNLTINGSISITNTQVTGLGSLATSNSVAYGSEVTGTPINGSTGAITVTTSPSGSGLFLGADHLGYYASGAWKTYMDSSGNFYLGGTSGSLQWNGSTLAISGSITSTSGSIAGFSLSNNQLQNVASGGSLAETTLNNGVGMGTAGYLSFYYNSLGRAFIGGVAGYGEMFLFNAAGTQKIYADGSTGQIEATSFNVA